MAVFAYFVVISGLASRDSSGAVRLVSATLAGAIVLLYVLRAPSHADRIDRGVLFAALVFAVSAIFSDFPRQSFDSVLAVLLYAAALFKLRGTFSRESARRLFVAGLMALSGFLTIAISLQMIAPFIEWWALTDWTVFPPLDLRIRPQPWILHYELALMLLILYPSWWIGRVGKRRAIGGAIVGLLLLCVIAIAGSRSVWLASIAGIVAVAAPVVRRVLGWRHWRTAAIVASLLLVPAALASAGMWSSLGERVARTSPVLERASVWGPALAEWSERPLVGLGPGSFPWVLQRTDYFDTHSFSPRHPDSALVQMVVETGLIGLVATSLVLAMTLPAVVRRGSRASLFAITAWLTAGLTLNSAESEFLLAVVIGWVAFAVPRYDLHAPAVRHIVSWRRPIVIGATCLVGIAFASTTVAAISYSAARTSVAEEKLSVAADRLRLASALDPGLALYPRQLGTLMLIQGAPEAGIRWLQRATRTNPNDDLAWRTLGVAYAEAGDTTASLHALQQAVEVQRSDPANLLLTVDALRAHGDEVAARRTLAEIVQAWPAVVAAPGWKEFVRPSSTREILAIAHHRWTSGLPSPEPVSYQPLLIGVMTGVGEGSTGAMEAPVTATMLDAYVAVMRCDPSAEAALGAANSSDRRQPTYWELAIRQSSLEGRSTRDYERLRQIMTHSPLLSDPGFAEIRLNPLHENGSRESSADNYGYRRPAIDWPATDWVLPWPDAGFVQWHHEPEEATLEVGIEDILTNCVRRGEP